MTSNLEMITYAGFDYHGRRVCICPFGHVLVSTTLLNSVLMDSNGAYISEEARLIDEQVCYFVEPDEICLGDNQLRQLLISELGV